MADMSSVTNSYLDLMSQRSHREHGHDLRQSESRTESRTDGSRTGSGSDSDTRDVSAGQHSSAFEPGPHAHGLRTDVYTPDPPYGDGGDRSGGSGSGEGGGGVVGLSPSQRRAYFHDDPLTPRSSSRKQYTRPRETLPKVNIFTRVHSFYESKNQILLEFHTSCCF